MFKSISLFFNYSNEGFEIDRLKEAAKLLEGSHDFRSFMKVSKEQKTVFLFLLSNAKRNFYLILTSYFSCVLDLPIELWIALKYNPVLQ